MTEELKEIYDTISNYVLNTTALRVMTGMLVTGGIYCMYRSVKLLRDIRQIDCSDLEQDNSDLEEKLED